MSRCSYHARFVFITLMLSFCVILPSLLFAKKKGNAGPKLKAVPVPAKNPSVLKLQRAYEKDKDAASEAQKSISQQRMDFQRMMHETGGVALMSKPNDLVAAENKLKDLEYELKEIAEQKLSSVSDSNLHELRASANQLKDDLKFEKSRSGPGDENPKLASLAMRLTAIESELRRYEKELLSKQSEYVQLFEVYKAQKEVVKGLQREFAMERKASQESKRSNPELEGKKQQIDSAVQAYSAAYKKQQQSRKALEVAIQKATLAYKQYLYKKEEQRQKQLQKSSRKKKGQRGNQRGKSRRSPSSGSFNPGSFNPGSFNPKK